MVHDYKKSKNNKSKHEKILNDYKSCEEYYGEEYSRGRKDAEFALGQQWPEEIKAEREADGRPCLTENRMLPFIHQVVNQIRQSRPSIIVKPVDSDADVETAKIIQGIIKNIEITSKADVAYDTAAYNAVSSAYGWIRVNTEYADSKSFRQKICIDRINNPFSVYLDPNSQSIDGSDAEYVIIYDDVMVDDFKKDYPDAEIVSFEDNEYVRDWNSEETIRVVEYYYKDYDKKTLVQYQLPTYETDSLISLAPPIKTGYKDEIPEDAMILNEREVEVCTIRYCKATASEILEEKDFPGKYLPIVPVYGFETWSEGRRSIFSLINQAKDPQRMFNYWKTASTEIVALQPKTPYIGALGQFKTRVRQWVDANKKNHAFLEYDIVEKNGQIMPPPQRQAPPAASATMFQETMSAADGIKAALGMYDASMGQQTPDISGKAIFARQMQGDNSTFHFIDNLSSSMAHVGSILIDLIPLIYSEKDVVRIIGNDEIERMVPINQPVVKEGNDYRPINVGERPTSYNRMDLGEYDIVVEVGPSYSTRRQEAANAIIEISRVNPQILEVAGDILMKNLDVPNADVIAERIRSVMSPEVLGDDPEAARVQALSNALTEMQKKLEETESALMIKQNDQAFKNELERAKIDNERRKIEIESAKVVAEIEKIKAEINSKIPSESMENVANAISKLESQVDDITDALDVFLIVEEGKKASVEPKSTVEREEEREEEPKEGAQ